jgi:hypothetical protein
MSSINWKVPPAIADDEKTDWKARNDKTDWKAHNDKTDWKAHNDKTDWKAHNEKIDWTHNEKTDWKAHNEKIDWTHNEKTDWKSHNEQTDWKFPPSYDDDSDKNPFDDDNATTSPPDWKHISSFHDDSLTKTSPPNWKDIPPSHHDSFTKTSPPDGKDIFHDDSLTKTTPADRRSFHDNTPTEVAPADRTSFHDNSPTPTDNWNPSDNPKVPPSIHDDNSLPTYTPYLQLSHLLSLTWLAYPIISLIFVAFRLQLSLASAQSGLDTAQNDILSSCYAAQQAATGAASLPRYLALASNRQFADAANDAMDAARSALILSLDVLEVTLNFIIDWYRSTFLCIIELVVEGGFSLVMDAVQVVCN